MHPECQLAVIEESCDVGGVWSSSKLEAWSDRSVWAAYPELVS